MESFGHGQIVLRAQRPAAQFLEGRTRQRAGRALHRHLAAQHGQVRGRLGFAALKVRPQRLEALARIPVQRLEPDGRAGHAVAAPVLGACRLHYVAAGFQYVDKGREQLPVDAVLVEVVRRAVRGDGHHHLALEQRLEQPPQDHGVGDVGDLKLVKAQQPRLGCDQAGDRRDRIISPVRVEHAPSGLRVAFAPLSDQVMDARHEGVKVGAALSGLRAGRIEQVHQHGLAATGRPPQIDAAHLRDRAEQAAPPQVLLQPLQRGQSLALRRIGGDHPFLDADVVGAADVGGHGRPLKEPRLEKRLLRARDGLNARHLPETSPRSSREAPRAEHSASEGHSEWATKSPSSAPRAMWAARC